MKPTETDSKDVFTTETAGLANASGPSVIQLHDGDQQGVGTMQDLAGIRLADIPKRFPELARRRRPPGQ
jgi:hypothetical protein